MTAADRTHHVSNSEIQTWKLCKRKWYLAHYLRLRPRCRPVTGALHLGSAVHEALAAYYAPEPEDPTAVLRRIYHQRLDDPENAPAVGDISKEFDLALAMVEGYLQWLEESGADDGLTVVGAEVEMAAPIEGLPVTLIGKLDTRVRRESDGALYSMDHKTAGSFDSVTKLLDINEQPLTYQLLERLTAPTEQQTVGGMVNILRKVKRTARAVPPFYRREVVHHNDDELRAFYIQLSGTLADMLYAEGRLDAGESHHAVVAPSPGDHCSWRCEFRAVCPALNDPRSYGDQLLATAYERHNPYERYESEQERPST